MSLNPVERRLAYLCGEWLRFRENPNVRLLVWQVPENAFRLVEAFVEAQKYESDYTSGDLFILFKAPYEHTLQYSRALKDAFRAQYDASHEGLKAEGLPVDWHFDPAASPGTPAAFVAALRSFGSKYHHSIGHLVSVLMPVAMTDEAAFADWVLRALAVDWPERMRILLIDSLENPRFQRLLDAKHPRIELSRPQVDGLTVAQETFAQEPVQGPAGVFRNHLTGLLALTEKGTADQVKAKAKDALVYVRRQQWLDQEVVVRLLVAGALLKENRHDEAVQVYRSARQVAQQVAEQGHPAGNKLVLQTWFGEAGAHLAKGDAETAGLCYDQAAPLAQRDRNGILGIEAFRMGAYCRARTGDVAGALERGRCAYALGEQLKPEARGMTTLPLTGIDLLRALDPERVALMEQVKANLQERTRSAGKTLEEQLQGLGGTATAEAEGAIEQAYLAAIDELKAESATRLDHIVADADETFRTLFARSRELLGNDWPLFSELGLMAPAAEQQVKAA